MANIDILEDALTEWGVNVVKSVLPTVQIPPTSTIGRMMSGFFGINPSTYSIYNELGFIIEPTVKTLITPMISKYVGSIPDEQIKDIAFTYCEAFKRQAQEKGYVNMFGVQLGESVFVGLENILTDKFK